MLTREDLTTAERWRKLSYDIGWKACHGSAHEPVDALVAWERSGWYDYLRLVDAVGVPRPVFFPSSGQLRHSDLGRVMDWGAGAGRLTPFVLDAAEEVVNVDASPHLLALGPTHKKLACIVASDPTEMTVEGYGQFDLIFSIHVLYSLRPNGVAATIRALATLLKYEGRLVLDIAVKDGGGAHHEDPDPVGLPGGWWVHEARRVANAGDEAGLTLLRQPPPMRPPLRLSHLAEPQLWIWRKDV
jgi:SAM-dependent methyltransferase